MASQGYVQDDFLKYFVKKHIRRSPLINRGYYVRSKCVHDVLSSFLNIKFSNISSEKCQIISCGAGFDTSYFQLKSTGKLSNCLYVEIDFAEVMKRKLQCIQNSSTLNKQLSANRNYTNGDIVLSTEDYILVGADLRDINGLSSIFQSIRINYSAPTLFLSECVIVYLDVKSSNSLIEWSATDFPNSVFVTYEQVYPEDGFGQVMQNHFLSIGSPLKTLTSFPTVASQHERYLSLGWTSCCVFTMNEFYNNLPGEEKRRLQSLEMFDEFEEWHLKCSHYVVVCAGQGMLSSFVDTLIPKYKKYLVDTENTKYTRTVEWKFLPVCLPLTRYGHKSALVNNNLVAVTGGFGQLNGKHQRLSDLILYDVKTHKYTCFDLCHNHSAVENMHHSLIHLRCGCLLMFGGRSSPMRTLKELLCIYLQVHSGLSTDSFHIHDTNTMWSVTETELQTNIYCNAINTTGNGPCERWRHSATHMYCDGEEYIIIFGGCNLKEELLGDCYMLNVRKWNWTQISTSGTISFARHSHSAVQWNSNIIISCGLGRECMPLNSVIMLDIISCSWIELHLPGLLPRYSHTSHIWKDKLLLIGGINIYPEYSPGIALIDLISSVVQEVKLPHQDPEHPILLHKHSSELIEEMKQILILGGGGNCFSFGTHLNFFPLLIPLVQFNL